MTPVVQRETAFARLRGLFFTGQFAKFLLAGGLAAAANFLSRFLFDALMGFWPAVTLAYAVGFLTAFTLNRIFVFPASGKPIRHELKWFFVFNALALPVVVLASIGLHRLLHPVLPEVFAKALAHGISIMLPVFANFVAHKFVTFWHAEDRPA